MNLRRESSGGSEDARGETLKSNQQPQPQDPTPQRDRHIMRRTHSPGAGGEGQDRGGQRRGEEALETPADDVVEGENAGAIDRAEGEKNVDQRVFGSVHVGPEHLENRKEKGMRKALRAYCI